MRTLRMRKLVVGALTCVVLGVAATPALGEKASAPPEPSDGRRLERPSPFESVPASGFSVVVPERAVAIDLNPGDPIVEDHAAWREQAAAVLSVLDPDATEDDTRDFVDLMYDLQLEFGLVLALWDTSNRSYCEIFMMPTEMDEAELDDYAAANHDEWSADSVFPDVRPPEVVELPAGPSRLLAYTQGTVEGAYYMGYGVDVGYGLDVFFTVDCHGPERPEDDWRYVVETLEWLPENT